MLVLSGSQSICLYMHNGSLENSEKNENNSNSSNCTNCYNYLWNRRIRSLHVHTKSSPQPTPTPTPTPTPSPTPTPTVTPSPSPTATSATASPTPTASPTASPSPSPSPTPTPSPTTLRVATTTSLYDTGLEDTPETLKNGTVVKDDLKDAFQAKYPWITVNFIALGTGAAIAQAQRGDADMLLVHSPSQELTYLKGGYGVDRKIIAYNYFIIVGPASDPAHISGLTNVSQALKNIYDFCT